MHYKQVANRRKEKWQTGGRDKCLSAAEPSEVLKVWLIRIPSFCVDDSNSVPILPLPIIFFCTIGPGSSIHKLYDLRSPNSQPSELGNLTNWIVSSWFISEPEKSMSLIYFFSDDILQFSGQNRVLFDAPLIQEDPPPSGGGRQHRISSVHCLHTLSSHISFIWSSSGSVTFVRTTFLWSRGE